MINSIPTDLKIATGAGIGMFLSIIGLREMGWIRDDGATLVNIGQTESWGGTVMKGDDYGTAVPCVDTVSTVTWPHLQLPQIQQQLLYGNTEQ